MGLESRRQRHRSGRRAHAGKLYHMGIRGRVSRNTLANANRRRDWQISAEFAQELIRIARPLYAGEDLGLELDNAVFGEISGHTRF